MKSKHYLLIATALVTVIFVAGNLLAQKVLTGAQIDFTKNHSFVRDLWGAKYICNQNMFYESSPRGDACTYIFIYKKCMLGSSEV